MSKVLKSPSKYVQGPGVLGEFDQYLRGMGRRLLVIIRKFPSLRVVSEEGIGQVFGFFGFYHVSPPI